MIIYIGEKKETFDLCCKVKISKQIKSDSLRQIQELDQATLFLVDKELDHGDGFIVIDLVKNNKKFKGLPIVLLSENMTEEDFDEHRFSDQAVNQYFQYPLKENDFIGVLKQLSGKSAEPNQEAKKSPEPANKSLIRKENSVPTFSPSASVPPLAAKESPSAMTKTLTIPSIELDSGGSKSATVGMMESETILIEQDPIGSLFKDPNLEELYKGLETKKQDKRTLSEKLLGIEEDEEFFQKQNLMGKEISISLSEKEELITLRQFVKLQEQENEIIKEKLGRTTEQKEVYHRESSKYSDEVQRLESIVDDLTSQSKNHEDQLVRLNSQSLKHIDELREENRRLREENSKYQMLLVQEKDKIEKLKDKLHVDVRNIRSRERELENKLEIVRKDAETLLANRDQECLELKKKMDSLEYSLQQQKEKEKVIISKFESEKGKLISITQKLKEAFKLIDE